MAKKLFIVPVLILLSLQAAFGQEAPDLRISPSDHPAAETSFVPSIEEQSPPAVDPDWYLRPGAKKGLIGTAETDHELRVVPDTAVLARGFSLPWAQLLAGEQEASVRVSFDDIALLNRTKPLLIIPSGGLEGTGRSSFFKAALEEYVRSGGVIFCLAQRTGADFSVLPVPDGQRLEAVGWSEDSGPFFRASAVQTDHALLSSLTRPVPSVETDGYLVNYPSNAQVLLVRNDGVPTAVVYPFGKGWVAATTLFTDFSSLLGPVNPEEKILIRNLLAWSKAAAKEPASHADVPQNTCSEKRMPLRTPHDHGVVEAAAERSRNTIKLSVTVPSSPKLVNETLLVRAAGQERSVTTGKDKIDLAFEIPVQGIGNRISYALYEKNGACVYRGTVAVPPAGQDPAERRSCYRPGDAAVIDFRHVGNAEIMLSGAGFLDNMIISDKGSISVPMPEDLPAGTYRMRWTREGVEGDKNENTFPLDLCGTSIEIRNAVLEMKRQAGKLSATAALRIRSTRNVSGRLKLLLRSPDGSTITAAEPVLSLVAGFQTVPVPFTFTPALSGIWELVFRFTTSLPQGAGIPSEPVELASGSVLFDVGEGAILGIEADKPFYYDPSGPAIVTAALHGTGKAAVELQVDGERVSKERLTLKGTVNHQMVLPALNPGTHTIRVLMSGDGMSCIREQELVYGLRLPDLAVTIRTSGPGLKGDAPIMPLTVTVRNQGKTASGPSRAGVFGADPAKGGKMLMGLDVPSLAPRQQQVLTFALPLTGMAGPRTLVAVADVDNAVQESNKQNNRSSVRLTVPSVVLFSDPDRNAFSADEEISLPVSVFNLSSRPLRGARLSAVVTNSTGKDMVSQIIPVPEIEAGAVSKQKAMFRLGAVEPGSYRFTASVVGHDLRPSAATTFSVLPTLQLAGSLEGTAASAQRCKPFSVSFRLKNAGNIRPSSGTVRVEILSAADQKLLLTKQLPLDLTSPGTIAFDTNALTQGQYKVRLRASAEAAGYKLSREFLLAEQSFSVTSPLIVKRSNKGFPRVLVWIGRETRLVEQAVSESIVKQAFEQEDLYFKVVDSEEDFSSHAMTGLFNCYVLFEPDGMVRTDFLKDRLGRGEGIVIIGAGEIARALAQEFGFKFEDRTSKQTSAMLSFTGDSGLGLSGTLPVTGKKIVPRKPGTVAAAVYSSSREPAALADISRKGKIVVMPFSFAHSAFEGGSSELYGLVLRKTAFFVVPGTEDGPVRSFTISSTSGPVNAELRFTPAPGSSVLWSNSAGKADGNSMMCAFKADREPKKLFYLYTPSEQPPVAEVFCECGGRFVSQGKAE